MSNNDIAIVESARERRARLGSAFVYGRIEGRRALSPLHKRIIIGIVVGAIAVAVCAGVSFVTGFMKDRSDSAAANSATAGALHLPVAFLTPDPSVTFSTFDLSEA